MFLALNVHVLIDVSFMFVVMPAACHSQYRENPNKACEGCFFCRSVPFCTSCDRYPAVFAGGISVGAQVQVLAAKGSSPRFVLILKERYSLKFKIKPTLTRELVIRFAHANPLRNSYLKEALYSHLQK